MNDRIFRGSSCSVSDLVSKVTLRIAKWALVRKEFWNFNLNDILFNWEACMGYCPFKERRFVSWYPPPIEVLKFNVDGASRGKPRSIPEESFVIIRVKCFLCFPGMWVSVNWMKQRCHLFWRVLDCFREVLLVLSLWKVIPLMQLQRCRTVKEYLWEFQFHLNEIMELSATITCWRMC